jgi:hypothetical protein
MKRNVIAASAVDAKKGNAANSLSISTNAHKAVTKTVSAYAIGRSASSVTPTDRREMTNLIEVIIEGLVEEKCRAFFSNEQKLIGDLACEIKRVNDRIEKHESMQSFGIIYCFRTYALSF